MKVEKETKRVVLFIVEGVSDESALEVQMEEFFANNSVKFYVVHGDITTELNNNCDNIIERIQLILGDFLEKYPFILEDIIKIVHIVDTDGAFIDDKLITRDDDQLNCEQKILYFEDKIIAKNPYSIRLRNNQKSEILRKLFNTSTIKNIPYSIYYNSRNLEHVLYNIIEDCSSDKKMDLADEFSIQYDKKVNEFIDFISNSSFAVQGKYRETWYYIMKDCNSLQRHTNMHLIFSDTRFN